MARCDSVSTASRNLDLASFCLSGVSDVDVRGSSTTSSPSGTNGPVALPARLGNFECWRLEVVKARFWGCCGGEDRVRVCRALAAGSPVRSARKRCG